MFKHWRDLHRHWEDWANVCAGIWLVFTPWLFDFERATAAMLCAVVAGAILIFVASLALTRGESWEEWVNIAIGLALIAGAALLDFAGRATAQWVFLGTGILVAGLAAFELREEQQARGPTRQP